MFSWLLKERPLVDITHAGKEQFSLGKAVTPGEGEPAQRQEYRVPALVSASSRVPVP